MALWPAKKDQGEESDSVKIDVPSTGEGADDAAGLEQLTGRLAELEALLGQTNKQVLEYLIHRDQEASAVAAAGQRAADDGQLDLISGKVDKVADKIDKLTAIATEATGEAPAAAAPAAKSDAPSVSEETLRAAMTPLQEALSQLDGKINTLSQQMCTPNAMHEMLQPPLAQIFQTVNEQKEAVAGAFRQLRQRVDDGLGEVVGYVRPPEPEPEPENAQPAGYEQWQTALLGRELAGNPSLLFQRQQLIDGLLAGNPECCSLVGQLLVFQSATPEKVAQLLKDVGEAYYRWQPKTGTHSDPMEAVLVNWLTQVCDEKGVGNTIELVHPGERFDSSRHTAATRGVEIAEVCGWIVLRDNGRVYTKANVVAR